MYRITDQLRLALKEPLGRLVSTEELVTSAKKAHAICAVGDECIYVLLANGVKPNIGIFDNLTKRQPVGKEKQERILGYCAQAHKVNNPPGTITDELASAVEKVCRAGSGFIEVNGEEDLATIAAMLYGKEDLLVIYGQPEAGAVIVRGGKKAKEKARELLASFEKA